MDHKEQIIDTYLRLHCVKKLFGRHIYERAMLLIDDIFNDDTFKKNPTKYILKWKSNKDIDNINLIVPDDWLLDIFIKHYKIIDRKQNIINEYLKKYTDDLESTANNLKISKEEFEKIGNLDIDIINKNIKQRALKLIDDIFNNSEFLEFPKEYLLKWIKKRENVHNLIIPNDYVLDIFRKEYFSE